MFSNELTDLQGLLSDLCEIAQLLNGKAEHLSILSTSDLNCGPIRRAHLDETDSSIC